MPSTNESSNGRTLTVTEAAFAGMTAVVPMGAKSAPSAAVPLSVKYAVSEAAVQPARVIVHSPVSVPGSAAVASVTLTDTVGKSSSSMLTVALAGVPTA